MSIKVLYISGSIGLGHVNRDLAIADALRCRRRDVDISWLAADPAAGVLARAGEHLHPQAGAFRSETAVADEVASDGALRLLDYAFRARREWLANALLVRRLLDREVFDVVVGDETYELVVAQIAHLLRMSVPFVMLYDFLGLDAMTRRWSERLGVYLWNLVWSRDRHLLTRDKNRGVFIGEPDDIPDTRFGPLLPNRRQHAHHCYEFVGYVLPFSPDTLGEQAGIRAELGYGPEPLVVCAVGGLAVGRRLLELCGRASKLLARTLPDLHMVLVCGPGIAAASLDVPPGLDVRGFVPDLYKHFAASDLAVVQGGGTTTLELTALRRRFVYFPIAGQCEQEITVAARLARHHAGVRMSLATTAPADLADTITANLGAAVAYPSIPVDGAGRIADLVLSVI